MKAGVFLLFLLFFLGSVSAEESYNWVRAPTQAGNITYLNVTNQTIYMQNNTVFENITVTNIANINSSNTGTATEYWNMGLLNLGIFGTYPLLTGYSGGPLGNLGAIQPGLIIINYAADPYLQFVDGNTLANGILKYDVANTRFDADKEVHSTTGFSTPNGGVGYLRMGDDVTDRTVLVNALDIGYGPEFSVTQYEGTSMFNYMPLFACNYMFGGCRIPTGLKLFLDGVGFSNSIYYDGVATNLVSTDFNLTTKNNFVFYNETTQLIRINGTDLEVSTMANFNSNLTNGGVAVCLLNGTNCPSSFSFNNITIQEDIIINTTGQLSFGNSTTYAIPLNGTQEGIGFYINGSVLNLTRRDLRMNGTITTLSGFIGGPFTGTAIAGTTGTFSSTTTFGNTMTQTLFAVENQSIQGLLIRSTRASNATNAAQNSPWLQLASTVFWGANKIINWTILSDPGINQQNSALNFSFSNNNTIQMFGDGSMNVPANITSSMAIIGLGSVGFPNALYLSNVTQRCTSTTVRQNVTFTHNIYESNISRGSIVNTSRIFVNESGYYEIIPSIVVDASAVNKHIDVWLSVNGANVALSNTHYETPLSGESLLTVALNQYLNKNDYFEIAWACADDANMILLPTAEQTAPARPESPSVIMTVKKVSR